MLLKDFIDSVITEPYRMKVSIQNLSVSSIFD